MSTTHDIEPLVSISCWPHQTSAVAAVQHCDLSWQSASSRFAVLYNQRHSHQLNLYITLEQAMNSSRRQQLRGKSGLGSFGGVEDTVAAQDGKGLQKIIAASKSSGTLNISNRSLQEVCCMPLAWSSTACRVSGRSVHSWWLCLTAVACHLACRCPRTFSGYQKTMKASSGGR